MVGSYAKGECRARGGKVEVDPAFGCLHEDAYGRPFLACDLVEEWRVFLADRLVLGLINRKGLSGSARGACVDLSCPGQGKSRERGEPGGIEREGL